MHSDTSDMRQLHDFGNTIFRQFTFVGAWKGIRGHATKKKAEKQEHDAADAEAQYPYTVLALKARIPAQIAIEART